MQETPQQYRQRMLSNIEGRNTLRLLAATPRRLERLVQGSPLSALRRRPTPQRWSVAEIVSHLADCELARSFRIRLILGAPGTPLPTFDQDAWVVALHYDKRSIRRSIEEFRVLRRANLTLFRAMTFEQWKSRGIHAERGEETIEDLVRITAGHDVNHMRQIEAILKSRK